MTKPWPIVKLGEVLKPTAREEKVDASKEYRLLGIRLDGQGPFLRETVMGTQTSASKLFRVENGDFIYSRLFACRGAFGVIGEELADCYVSGEFPSFVPVSGKVDIHFLKYWFRLPSVIARVDADCTGSTPLTRNRFKENFFVALEIPLPPLAEQRRIVARIEELAAQIHEAQSLRQQAAQEAEAIYANTRDKVFSKLEAKGVIPQPELGDVARFRTGYAFKSSDYRSNGLWILRVSNIRSNGSIDRSDSVFLAEELRENYNDYQLDAGDILIVMVGGSVGKLCMVPEVALPALMNQNMWRICPNSITTLLPHYLFHFLHRINRNIGVGLTHSTHGHLTQTAYKAHKIPLPSLPEQRRIVAELDALQAEVDALKKLQTETAAELDALLPSLLDRAFKGDL